MTRFQVRKKLRKAGSRAKSIAVGTFSMGLGNVPVSPMGLRKASSKAKSIAVGTLGIGQAQAILLGATAVLVSVAAISPAQAATVTQYTNRADFTAASNSLTNIDFEGLAPSGGYTYYPNPTGLTNSGVNFVGGVDNTLYVVDPAFSPNFYDWGSGAVLSSQSGNTTSITATLPTGVTAAGSDIMSFSNYASDFVVTLNTGDVFTASSANYPNRSFFGIISDTAISSISYRATSGYTQLDNFAFGKANTQAVPEPFTILGSLTAGGIGVALRRKRQQQEKEAAKV